MGFYFLAIFVAMPIIEIAVFIQAGELIGLWPTIGIVILTAIIGTALMRAQGLQTLAKAQRQMDHGEMPIGAMFDGICILVAGVLLLTPGFVTDTMGFLLLIPPLRQLIGAKVIMKLIQSGNLRAGFGTARSYHTGPGTASSAQQPGSRGGSAQPGRRPGNGPIIDGDFEDVSPSGEQTANTGSDADLKKDGTDPGNRDHPGNGNNSGNSGNLPPQH